MEQRIFEALAAEVNRLFAMTTALIRYTAKNENRRQPG
jgi:hypothetical protein